MTAHSLLGASGAHRWLNCPGSFNLTRQMPTSRPSIYAATGSVAHDYIEKAVSDALAQGRQPGTLRIAQTEIGCNWSRDGHTVTVDQDLIDGVNVMLDYVEQVSAGADRVRCEFTVSLDPFFAAPPVPLFGRVDVAVLDRTTLEIVDYKNGAGVIVPPKDNPQLLYYAAGVLAELDDPDVPLPARVKLTIVQPHAPGIEQIRSWETSTLDVQMWIDEVLGPGVVACSQPDAPLVPGAWCRFCPAVHACPRLMQDAVDMAKRDFDDAVVPDDPDDLARALDTAEHAMIWATKVQEHALLQLLSQARIPGWEMVPTRPTRKWIDDEATTASVLSTAGVGDDVIWETKLRSPAQVDKALSKYKHGRQVWADVQDTLVHAVSSGFKLARSLRAGAKQEFSDVE